MSKSVSITAETSFTYDPHSLPPASRYVDPMVPIPPDLHLEVMAFLLRAEAGDPRLHAAGRRLLKRVQTAMGTQCTYDDVRALARQRAAALNGVEVEVDDDAVVSRSLDGAPLGVWVQSWIFIPAPEQPQGKRSRSASVSKRAQLT